ncbi:hypothetical protein P280DRAFT_504665 [Massarina eburnea CBS 473.64]|uniref:Uncharacterized protein n=1 Tax=Massarina eburnea CBS 473.64 TaxID=1395130 RepID=A0A6A6S9X9_9PLEO|nr:hypothetical protein P280DRAFT_504665 [Massarina eburnea CBS 473.64]
MNPASQITMHDYHRIFLVAILPLYMRSATLYRILAILFTAIVATSASVRFSKKQPKHEFAMPIVVGVVCSFVAAHLANYILVEGRLRLIFTYVIAFDGLVSLVPDILMPNIQSDLALLRSRTCQENAPIVFFSPTAVASSVSWLLASQYNASTVGKLMLCSAVIFVCIAALAQRTVALLMWWGRQCDMCGAVNGEASRADVPATSDTQLPSLPVLIVTDADASPHSTSTSILPISRSPIQKPCNLRGITSWNRAAVTYDKEYLCPVVPMKKVQSTQRKREK